MNTGTSNIPLPTTAYGERRKRTELCYMTAWQQAQPRDYRNPTPKEEQMNIEAVVMLTLLAALDYFVYDLIEEMEACGKYRQGNKRNINRAKDIILSAHSVFYKKIYNEDFDGCRAYNEAMELYYKVINQAVLLEAPERAYNIVVAICRLQAKQRAKIERRYFYAPSVEVEKIPAMLEVLGIHDYHLDNIIENCVYQVGYSRRGLRYTKQLWRD